ncbi:hypothetical protein OV090_03920 [Nannocystis sp. RBIL2]|uniref:hypothetical protein n=1 Tax=Nannocystis sp. RBIL2 TaxID=2996788 RepID=UPI00226FA2AD|nr:hypothetical protein [Nannocystis sp. RBIL2]MCY1063894.1 hypothetical protein [Nannocystis sp. RBIL2]
MLALAALVFVRLSSAAPPVAAPPVDLTWQAPRECPDGDDVLLMVAGLLRQPTGDDAPGRPGARGLITRAGAAWELRLVLRGRGSDYRRTVRAESCPILARAAALLIAIHLDPLAVARGLPAPAVVPPAPPALPPDLSPGTATIPPPGPSDLSPRTSATSASGTAPPADLSSRTSTTSASGTAPPTDLSSRTSSAPPSELPARPVLPPDPLASDPSRAPSIPAAPDLSFRPAPPPSPAGRLASPAPPRPPAGPSRPLAPEDMSEETAEFTAARTPRPAAPPRVLGHLRLEGGLDVGVLPGAGGLVGLFGGVTLPRLRLEAGLVGAPGRILPGLSDRPGGRFDRLGGVVRICPTWLPRPALAVLLCAGFEVGALHGVARDVSVPSPRWAPWASFFLGPALRWRVAGPLGLWLAVEGLVAVNRPIFTVGAEEVYRGGRAGLRTTFGLDLQFGPRNR